MVDIVCEEYVVVGICGVLYFQVDFFIELCWVCIYGGWGEDVYFILEMVVEYIKGFQGEIFGFYSVIIVIKYFLGGGVMENGEDSYFFNGKNQIYFGRNMDYYLIFFCVVFEVGVR